MYRRHYFLIRLLLTVMAVALPLIALHAYTLQQQSERAEAEALQSIRTRSISVAQIAEQSLGRAELLLNILSSRGAIVSLNTEGCEELVSDLVHLDPLYANAVVANASGRLVCVAANKLAGPPPSVLDSPWFRNAFAADGFMLSSPFVGRVAGRPIAMLSRPLVDAQGHKVGVVGLSIDLTRLSEAIGRQGTHNGATTALIDSKARLVARYPYEHERIGHETSVAWKDARLKQPTGAVTGKGLDGVERLVYATDVGRYGLRAAAGISTAAVMGPVHSTLERSIAVALATLLCGIGLAVYSARGLVRPLRSLANTARAWGRGVAGPRADETLPGAFGTLAAEFNHMVSAREKSQALLLESQERYSQMLDGVDMIAVRVRFDGTLIYCNDALVRILGWTREELLGRGWIDRVISSEAGALVLRYKNGFDENRFQRSRDVEFRTRSGQTRLIRLNSSVVFDGSGQPESLSSIGEDITQQREVERAMEARRQAEAANLAKTNFLSRMSHELRTPLNAVIGFSRLLRDSAARKLSTTETHQLDLVVSAATQLNALIDDVLDIASIEGGRTSVDVREVDLFRLVEDALRMSDAAAVARGVRLLRPAAPHASLGIQTDPIRLRQIVLNLLSNGIKYNRDGGSVRIDIELVASLDATDGAAANHASLTDEASAGAVRITVHDSGAGMTPDQLANLFQPFNRLGREKGNVEGTGIGMVLSKQLTSLLGGTLAVSSQVGVGTSVQLTLPRVGALWAAGAKEGSREEPTPSAPLPAMDLDVAADNTADLQGAAQPHGRVLYIEDNQVNAVLVERLLSRWPDVQVSVAEDGTSGLALAAQQQPHLLLLDMHLPDMDGLAVLEALRASPGTRHIPVVALSANAMPDEVQATLDAGALAYWTKPIDFDSFLAGMHSLLTPAHLPVVQRTEATLGTD